jgi:hypothetical protein
MTNATVQRPSRGPASQEAPAGHEPDRVPRRVAGFTILGIAVLSGVGNFIAVQPLADHGITAAELTNGGAQLRLGIAALSVVAILDVCVSFSLYRAFRLTGKRLMGIASGLRIAYAAGFAIAISQLVPIARHLDGDLAGAGTAARRAGVEAGVERFNDVWHVALAIFGLHLIALAVAARKGGLPRILMILLAIAGGGYILDTSSNLLTGSSLEISAYTFVGEFALALWLVAVRRRSASRYQQAVSPHFAPA